MSVPLFLLNALSTETISVVRARGVVLLTELSSLSELMLKFIILGKIDIEFWSNPSRLIEFPCHVRR